MIEAIIQKLKDTPAVSAIVGANIWPVRRPQAVAFPNIVVSRISGNPIYTDRGEEALESARITVDCWGATWSSATLAARAVRASLSAFVGTAGGVVFQNVLLDAERDFNEGGANAAEYPFRVSLDFIVWFEI